MKKLIGIICSLLICGTLFTSFSPSLDGRAIVAEEGVLPQGLFAKAFGYLPGDSISVTSLSSKESVDILVIGALQSKEGIAILLSPEAAVALGISKTTNNVVKITKRSGQLDEAVVGTAVIGSAAEDFASYDNSEETDDDDEEVAEEFIDEDSVNFAVAAESKVEETPVDSEAVEADVEYISATEPEAEEVVTEVEQADEITGEKVVTEVEKADEIADEKDVVVITPTEEAAEEDSLPEEAVAAAPEAEEKSAEEVVEEPVEDEEEVIAEEYVEADDLYDFDDETEKVAAPFDEALNEDYDAVKPAEDAVAAVEKAEESETEKTSEALEEEVIAEAFDESKVAAEEDAVVAETEKTSDSDEDESYEPIVLVPASANPPVAEEKNVEDAETAASVEETAQPVVSTASDSFNFDKYIVSSLSDLEKGKYYVQIAMLGSEDNIRSTIKKYGKQYPITLVPLASGKGYQFLIGSLNMDEYGTVLNRFKSYGYKDAFLRRIK
ncbi:MAG: hypothetical protein MR494_08415 [Spirochaetia bacterium]|nr:hypothetical protein [Spirochaetia bacterium]